MCVCVCVCACICECVYVHIGVMQVTRIRTTFLEFSDYKRALEIDPSQDTARKAIMV